MAGARTSLSVSFLLQYQFEARAAFERTVPDDCRVYANRSRNGELFIIIGKDLFKAYVRRTRARSRIYTADRE